MEVRDFANKAILLSLCATIHVGFGGGEYAVVALIASVTAAALQEYFEDARVKRVMVMAVLAAAAFYAPLAFYLPLIAYDARSIRPFWLVALSPLPLGIHIRWIGILPAVLTVLLLLAGVVMAHQAALLKRRRTEGMALRDSAAELSAELRERNRALLKSQDDQIKLAKLDERNRIAREMHDSVGHVLSSAILQTGALMAVSRDDADRGRLRELHATLSRGMGEVRSAIHDLHDESIDLQAEIRALAGGFTGGGSVSLNLDISDDVDRKVKYALIAIVKEALANVARHSDATRVGITLAEHPAFYQLIVADNGPAKGGAGEGGMGLENIRARVEQLGGMMNIRRGRGFELFVSIQKRGER